MLIPRRIASRKHTGRTSRKADRRHTHRGVLAITAIRPGTRLLTNRQIYAGPYRDDSGTSAWRECVGSTSTPTARWTKSRRDPDGLGQGSPGGVGWPRQAGRVMFELSAWPSRVPGRHSAWSMHNFPCSAGFGCTREGWMCDGKGLTAVALRSATEEELDSRLSYANIERFNLRFAAPPGSWRATGGCAPSSKEIARIYTVKRSALRHRDLGEEA